MNSPDEPTLEHHAGTGRGKKKGRGRKGMRVAATAGVALGLTVVGAGVAGAATTVEHAHDRGKYSANEGGRPAAVGTVATVGTSSITLTTLSGSTLTVDVAATSVGIGTLGGRAGNK